MTWRPPGLSALPSLSCLFFGRGEEPRPDPLTLLPRIAPDASSSPLVTLRQVHSSRCVNVGPTGAPGESSRSPVRHDAGEGDALVTRERGVFLGIATADCLPLVAVDDQAGAVAVIHAGWRGTLAGVLETTLTMMIRDHGAAKERIRVAAGPAAGSCCYEVGAEVIEAFRSRRPKHANQAIRPSSDGRCTLDLLEANRAQAQELGVARDHITSVKVCTICSPAVCHSYRREGALAGRMWLLAGLTA